MDTVRAEASRAECPACRKVMVAECRDGITVDRCVVCQGYWFDATELDLRLAPMLPPGASPPEARVPERGLSTRRCPRCQKPLKTAGWDGLVLDRCPTCRGIFVEWREWRYLLNHDAPHDAQTFESQFREAMIAAGFALLYARAIAIIVMRFWR